MLPSLSVNSARVADPLVKISSNRSFWWVIKSYAFCESISSALTNACALSLVRVMLTAVTHPLLAFVWLPARR